jgi:hypothetical protein
MSVIPTSSYINRESSVKVLHRVKMVKHCRETA